jgi:hypothetical protein
VHGVVNLAVRLLRCDGDGAGDAVAGLIPVAASGDAGRTPPAIVLDELAAAIFGLRLLFSPATIWASLI